MKSETQQKKEQALMMRVGGTSYAKIAKALKVSEGTLVKWEHGWFDAKGIKHAGWREELIRLQRQREAEELERGLMAKQTRIKGYEKYARKIAERIDKMLPELKGKRSSDFKALMSEYRELCRMIGVEKGEVPCGHQTSVAVKTDITLSELRERYINAKRSRERQPE